MSSNFEQALQAEASEVLSHSSFARSPMQRQLLMYLVSRTLARETGTVTQYDIATEALGKPNTFDETTDSYVRVQISRLRKSLKSYYSIQAPGDAGCIYIKSGSYQLSLGTIKVAYPDLAVALDGRTTQIYAEQKQAHISTNIPPSEALANESSWLENHRFGVGIGVLSTFALAAIAAMAWPEASDPLPLSTGLERPLVSLETRSVGFAPSVSGSDELVQSLNAEARRRLARSIVTRVADLGDQSDFEILFEIDSSADESFSYEVELKERDGRSIYRTERDLEGNIDEMRAQIGWEVAALVSPPGIVSRELVKSVPATPRNDFECYLVTEVGRIGDGTSEQLVEQCKARFPESEYFPYLRARELFVAFQSNAMTRAMTAEEMPEWTELSALLSGNPQNPYLNALAAKILYAQAQCVNAEFYGKRAMEQGRDLPIIEMILLLEKPNCIKTEEELETLREEAVKVATSQTQPSALFEVYAIASLILADRPELVAERPEEPFALDRDIPLVQFAKDMREYALGEQQDLPALAKSLAWSDSSRQLLRLK